MARSERYIAPSREQIRRLKEAEARKREMDLQRTALIDEAVRRRTHEELVAILSKLAVQNIKARWKVESALDLCKPVGMILHDLREAIELATKVDERRLDYNFAIDGDAYDEVQRLFEMLVSINALDEAMEIAVHFMKESSYQVECSDEGLMIEEIEDCLEPVLSAVAHCEPSVRASWASRMRAADRVGYICERTLKIWSDAER